MNLKEVSISSTINKEEDEFGIIVVKGIFKISPIVSLMITSLILAIYMFINYLNTSNIISLTLIFVSITTLGLMGFLLQYTLRTRKKLYSSLSEQNNNNISFIFSDTNIMIKNYHFDKTITYKTSNIQGHYQFYNYYMLYLDNKIDKYFILLKIDEKNIEKINLLIKFYHPIKRLQQLKRKNK